MLRHAASAVAFVLVCGAFVTASLVTQAGEDGWIRGTVLDPQGRALPGAEVSLRVPQGACKFVAGAHINDRTVTVEDGAFALRVPPGTMEIYVRHPDYAPGWAAARHEAVVQLKAASWIEGEVNTPATITVSRGPWRFVQEPIEGKFRCGPLPPDVSLSLVVTSKTHRLFSKQIILGPDETRAMDVTLPSGAQLKGSVFPAHEGVTIRAHGRDGREAVATTAQDGTFTVTGLDEGWVRLVVISPDRPVQVLDTSTGETVEVRWPR